MMFNEKFTEIKNDEATVILNKVNQYLDKEFVDLANVKMLSHSLNFYNNCSFIEILTDDIPNKRKIFIIYDSQNNDIAILNGTNDPIYRFNQNSPIQLNSENVLFYVWFFFNHVRGAYGRFLIINDIDDIKWREEPAPNAKKALSKMIDPLQVVLENSEEFVLKSSIIFKDSLFEADVIVKRDGQITLTRQEILVEDIPVLDDVFGQ